MSKDQRKIRRKLRILRYTEELPFRIREIRTDNGHEFQTTFHWHVEAIGVRHAYIKRGTSHLNGKLERLHSSDVQEIYQLA